MGKYHHQCYGREGGKAVIRGKITETLSRLKRFEGQKDLEDKLKELEGCKKEQLTNLYITTWVIE